MAKFHYEFRTTRTVDYALIAGAACLSIYWYIRPVLTHDPIKPRRVIPSKARDAAQLALSSNETEGTVQETLPYPPDAFPGARDVNTPYGMIKVFEWGPENGEKVLLMHGIGTPCVALGDMAKEFVRKGCRVMLFDFFGRGYSDAPSDLLYDSRLYTTQILLVLASSPLPWTGSAAFHLLGYSLGGAIAADFAAYYPHLLRSLTLVCPGGLVRPSHVSWKSRLLYSEGMLPSWIINGLAKRRLEPKPGKASADIPDGENMDTVDNVEDVDFDEVRVCTDDTPSAGGARVGDVVRWQLRHNDGFVPAYMSTIRNAPIYGQHDGAWRILGEQLRRRRMSASASDDSEAEVELPPPGLPNGRICLVLAERDPIVVKEEWMADSLAVLGEGAVDIRIVQGGHEVAISKGKEVANLAMDAWRW